MTHRFRWSRLLATPMVIAVLSLGCSSTDASPEAFCAKLAELGDLSITLDGDATVLEAASQELTELADVAPDEVKPSVQVLSNALATMGRAAAEAGTDSAGSLDAALGALAPDIAVIETASDNVDAYAEQNCQISLLDTPTTVEPS